MAEKSPRGKIVNSFTFEQLEQLVNTMLSKNQLVEYQGKLKCTLAVTKNAKGNDKYAQVDTNCVGKPGKQLVHLIVWRWINKGAIIEENLTISHIDADHKVMHLIQESKDINESRKYCHLFGWYKTKPGENRPRCPHWEISCTGF